MGVPKFYRWLSERYPCLSEVINDSQIPEFDNLYLDMNGIIHSCSHPNDDDVTFRITEEEIFQAIFKYIEKLFCIIKPRKVFFMAIDGVAPRAKMNQQRARRFMSAKNAEMLVKKAQANGEEIPTEQRFDSNCITPGTQFMTKLHARLCSWVEGKVGVDPLWQDIRVFLSGHDCPGEGEHKIMDFIRAERATDGYDPNTRHCMYGLDADLIMLGMCSHEPHFSLLREEVKFTRPPRPGQKSAPRKVDANSITFHLLHLSLLREYLAWEFIGVKDQLSFEYNMENIIDDWVLMGFLVGNDFIPHLPHVHIHDDALPLLYDTYMKVLPTLDGYINEKGMLNLRRFGIFLKEFSRNDRHCFLQSMEDENYLKQKREFSNIAPPIQEEEEKEFVPFDDSDMEETSDEEAIERRKETSTVDAAFVSSDSSDDEGDGGRMGVRGGPSHGVLADGGILSAAEALRQLEDDPIENEFNEAIGLLEFKEMDDKEFENNVDNCWTRTINNEFKRHKKRYYDEKMHFGNISKGQLKEQSEGYVRAIQWNLHYYYHGCCSWNWFFAHHYAPYISDVIDFEHMEMSFEMSEPFHPYEQLLAVLPAASSECLPRPLRELMCSAESPIADFYPSEFATDLNGKKNDWEAVVLIPFIDEKRLLEAIHAKENLLSNEEKLRNEHGGHVLFTTTMGDKGKQAKKEVIDKDIFRIPRERVVYGLLPNVHMDIFFPGFPTMKHLPHKGTLEMIGCQVFQQATRKQSLKLTVLERPELKRDMTEIAMDVLHEEACVDWPILKVAMVEEIWTETKIYRKATDIEETEATELDKETFKTWRRAAKERLMSRYGIDCGEVRAMARVRRLIGTQRVYENGLIVPKKQWTDIGEAVAVPLNLLVLGVIVDGGVRFGALSVAEAYPIDSKVFVMEPTWDGYGFPAFVREINDPDTPQCRVIVQAALMPQPPLDELREDPRRFSLPWMDLYATARQAEMDKALIGRLTGTVFMVDGTEEDEKKTIGRPARVNIGLNLKLSKRNLEVIDFARRQHQDGYWEYSILTVRILREYKNKFRDLISYLEKANSVDDIYYAGDVWENPEKRKTRLNELKDWLNGLPCADAEKTTGGMEYVDRQAMEHIEEILARHHPKMNFKKSFVNPAVLYRPAIQDWRVRADASADFRLFDRVTCITHTPPVPFGFQGTIIGVLPEHADVLFDSEFPGGQKMRSKKASCARVPLSALLNITYAKDRKGKPKVDPAKTGRPNTFDRSKRGQPQRGPPTGTYGNNSKEFSANAREFIPRQAEVPHIRQILGHQQTPPTAPQPRRAEYGAPPKQVFASPSTSTESSSQDKKEKTGKQSAHKQDRNRDSKVDRRELLDILMGGKKKEEDQKETKKEEEQKEKKKNRKERRKEERERKDEGKDEKKPDEVKSQEKGGNDQGGEGKSHLEQLIRPKTPPIPPVELFEKLGIHTGPPTKEDTKTDSTQRSEENLQETSSLHPSNGSNAPLFDSSIPPPPLLPGFVPQQQQQQQQQQQYAHRGGGPFSPQQRQPFHPRTFAQSAPHQQTNGSRRGDGRRGGAGGRHLDPSEYVKDKVTDFKPSSVGNPVKRGGRGRGRGATRAPMRKNSAEQTDDSSPAVCPSVAPPSEDTATPTARPARKPRIAAKFPPTQ